MQILTWNRLADNPLTELHLWASSLKKTTYAEQKRKENRVEEKLKWETILWKYTWRLLPDYHLMEENRKTYIFWDDMV